MISIALVYEQQQMSVGKAAGMGLAGYGAYKLAQHPAAIKAFEAAKRGAEKAGEAGKAAVKTAKESIESTAV